MPNTICISSFLKNWQIGNWVGGGRYLRCSYQEIIAPENLLSAWKEFRRGKNRAKDVQIFERDLVDNIFALNEELKDKTYQHGGYYRFRISDPKPRVIHKASVKDRLVHHAIHRVLYSLFDKRFIYDSYSCRVGKGTHKAMNRFKQLAHKLSQNNTRTVWVLKCDIKKFFDSINHGVLFNILSSRIEDKDVLSLLFNVIQSFSISRPIIDKPAGLSMIGEKGRGLPLGNLTSQLLANVYMNEFDQLVKYSLKQRYYIRYADDFVFLSNNQQELVDVISRIERILNQRLRLQLHPNKLFLNTMASGVDFLGWVHFPTYRVVRTVTKRRMMKTIKRKPFEPVLASYQGMLMHGNAYHSLRELRNQYGLFADKREMQ